MTIRRTNGRYSAAFAAFSAAGSRHVHVTGRLAKSSQMAPTPADPGSLELRDFREVEIAHLHRRHDHLERFFPGRPHRRPQQSRHCCSISRDRLIETEILNRRRHPSLFDQEQPVARHPRHDLFVRIDFADVPQPRDQQSAIGRSDHFLRAKSCRRQKPDSSALRHIHSAAQTRARSAFFFAAFAVARE